MNRKIRIALAALAALTALSTVGVTSVASAASRPTEGGVFAIAHNGVAEAVNTGQYWKEVHGWSIGGDGSTTTNQDCQDYADAIESALGLALQNAMLGNYASAAAFLVVANFGEDKALDADCVIAYT